MTKGEETDPVFTMESPVLAQKQREPPELTIANLYEIQRHCILFPKIVLAQAILETGWFRSHASRKKNNLFSLTNPRTGKYFEFDYWTESVWAYYTKVQYRYKGGATIYYV